MIDLIRREGHRHEQRVPQAIADPWTEDTDYGSWFAIDADLAADEIARGAEALPPQSVRENRDLIFARLAFLGEEVAPEKNRIANRRGKTRCDNARGHLLRPFAGGEIHTAGAERMQALKDRALALPVQIIRGGADVAAPLNRRPDHDELVRFRIGQRGQHQGVDDGEDRRGDDDAKREGHDGHRREPGVPSQLAQSEPDVAHGDELILLPTCSAGKAGPAWAFTGYRA